MTERLIQQVPEEKLKNLSKRKAHINKQESDIYGKNLELNLELRLPSGGDIKLNKIVSSLVNEVYLVKRDLEKFLTLTMDNKTEKNIKTPIKTPISLLIFNKG